MSKDSKFQFWLFHFKLQLNLIYYCKEVLSRFFPTQSTFWFQCTMSCRYKQTLSKWQKLWCWQKEHFFNVSCVRISEVTPVSAQGWRRMPGKYCMSPSVSVSEWKYIRGKHQRCLTEQNAILWRAPVHKLLGGWLNAISFRISANFGIWLCSQEGTTGLMKLLSI